jgi:SOS response regulatory protein OraA/RecX
VPFPSSYVWPARLTLSLQHRSRRNARQAMVVLAQRRRERDDVARYLAARGIEAT